MCDLVHCRAGGKATKALGWCGYEEVELSRPHRKQGELLHGRCDRVNGCEGVVCISAIWKLCGFCGIVCRLPVDFRWSVDSWLVMCVAEAQDGGVVGVA